MAGKYNTEIIFFSFTDQRNAWECPKNDKGKESPVKYTGNINIHKRILNCN